MVKAEITPDADPQSDLLVLLVTVQSGGGGPELGGALTEVSLSYREAAGSGC